MTQSATSVSDWFLNSARKNPEGALLLAAGAVLLLRRSGAVAAIADSDLAHQASESVRTAANSVKDVASDAAGTASQATKQYVSDKVSAVTEGTNLTTEKTLTAVRSAVEKVVKEQPLLVAMAGIVAGAGLAAILPASEFEKDALNPVAGKVSDAVNYVGDEAKHAFDRASEKFKEVAEERGLTSDGLKKMADDVVGAARPQSFAAKETK